MKDLYQSVTNRIVAAIEAGTPPWVRPWSAAEHRPHNAATKRPYRGINTILLSLEAALHGYTSGAYLTYRQAITLGGQVRGGEHGTRVVLFKRHEIPDPTSETKSKVIPLLRSFTVFNVDQIDGLPNQPAQPSQPTWDPDVEAEMILRSSGADIRYGAGDAYYQPAKDAIYLPAMASFSDSSAYYSTVLHELVHWTGNSKRCNRNLSGRFGNDAYAFEELIAELGSAFLCAHCRIDGRLQHAAYVRSWLPVLKNDKRAIFTAAAKAQQAADLLLGSVEGEHATEVAA